jgi:hypothetical protein
MHMIADRDFIVIIINMYEIYVYLWFRLFPTRKDH